MHSNELQAMDVPVRLPVARSDRSGELVRLAITKRRQFCDHSLPLH